MALWTHESVKAQGGGNYYFIHSCCQENDVLSLGCFRQEDEKSHEEL